MKTTYYVTFFCQFLVFWSNSHRGAFIWKWAYFRLFTVNEHGQARFRRRSKTTQAGSASNSLYLDVLSFRAAAILPSIKQHSNERGGVSLSRFLLLLTAKEIER